MYCSISFSRARRSPSSWYFRRRILSSMRGTRRGPAPEDVCFVSSTHEPSARSSISKLSATVSSTRRSPSGDVASVERVERLGR